jgi:glycosyltransferase involved in cell wall biosynthesis
LLRFDRSIAARARDGAAPAADAGAPIEHIGIINDYVRIPYATGSSFAAQFLHRQFERRGHRVTLVGPNDPKSHPDELPERHVLLRSVPIRSQPGFFLPFPSREGLRQLAENDFDMLLSQTGSELVEAGVWLRLTKGVPLLCVNTTMLNRLYDALLPEALSTNPRVQKWCHETIVPFAEGACVRAYNDSDGLVVLSEGLERYWRRLGVVVPIHVIPRAVDPRVVASPEGADPFHPRAKRGARLLMVCRHVREKNVGRIIDVFAQHIAPRVPEATLTLVGDGADHDAFKARAQRLGVGDRTFFPGEFPVTEVRSWYSHADLFLYGSLSETYGQVVSEAMYCGLPVVAFDDEAGVAQQVSHGRDGLLLPAETDREACNERFGAEVIALLADAGRRHRMADAARRNATKRSDPDRVVQRYYAAFEQARRHRALCRPDASALARARLLARWTGIHGLVSAMGAIRPPAVLNRRGARHPQWGVDLAAEATAPEPARLSGGEAA